MNKIIKDPVEIIIIALFAIGCFGYAYGILKACFISLAKIPDVSKMPAFLSNLITTIGAVLATNLGAILGLPKTETPSLSPFTFFIEPTVTNFQITACLIYLLALLVSSVVWGIKNFTTDSTQIVPTLPDQAKTFLGVLVGVLAITLAKQ
ncbi:MAG: hypothetical protein ABIQ27_07265 [Flavobacterium sp.]|uniref:hypothetical protein n=1 Tax=Flavobacterium sp. TaxID=239 RepID=UPI003267BCFF